MSARQDELLAANLAFYSAFESRDIAAMDALWSQRVPVSCVHPGWPALIGREQVMESWQRLLANPSSPAIQCHDGVAQLHGDSYAFVLCTELIDSSYLLATNLFVREESGWKIYHHHAGQAPAPIRKKESSETLH